MGNNVSTSILFIGLALHMVGSILTILEISPFLATQFHIRRMLGAGLG